MSEAIVSVQNLVYHWKGRNNPTLLIDQLTIHQGERLFIHGPSGSGKSTLLGLLAGVLLPTQGQVQLMNRSWSTLGAGQRDRFRADHVGYIFQQFNLINYLNALQNVVAPCFFSRLRKQGALATGHSVQHAALTLLKAMGISEDDAYKPASHLSIGQQQRVAAARAFIGNPRLIIADEPTSALDHTHRDIFMAQLLDVACRAGSTVVFVSHDLGLARHFDRCIALRDLNRAACVPSQPESVNI